MDSNSVRLAKPRPYWSFIAFLYSLLGWVLFDAWLFLLSAGFLWHVLVAIPAATLVFRSAMCPFIVGSSVVEQSKGPVAESRWEKLPCVLLYVVGATFGAFVLNGSFTLFGVIVALFTFAPWARLPFTRNHIAISCLTTISGFVSVLVIGHRFIDFMFLPFAAWVFWGFACGALIFRAENVQRARHETTAATKPNETETRPIHSPG